MESLQEMAAALEALAAWSRDKLAYGFDPEWVALQQVEAMLHLARLARHEPEPVWAT